MNFCWRAQLWHTSVSLCKNENGICTQTELQAVTNNKAGKRCSARNRAKERALILLL